MTAMAKTSCVLQNTGSAGLQIPYHSCNAARLAVAPPLLTVHGVPVPHLMLRSSAAACACALACSAAERRRSSAAAAEAAAASARAAAACLRSVASAASRRRRSARCRVSSPCSRRVG